MKRKNCLPCDEKTPYCVAVNSAYRAHIRRAFETVMVSRGIPIETASQMMGHKSITEDKPYITHDKAQVAFVAMDFSDVPISSGFYHDDSGGFPGKGGVAI